MEGEAVDVLLVGVATLEREGLRRLLDGADFHYRCVNPDEAVARSRKVDRNERHAIILDTSVEDPAELCTELLGRNPRARIAVMIDGGNVGDVQSAVLAGAHGVLNRNAPLNTLANYINLVAQGEKVVPSAFIRDLNRSGSSLSSSDMSNAKVHLSARELEVATCVAAGLVNKQIGIDLGLTEATVKVHVKAIMRKLGVANRTQVAVWAHKYLDVPAILEKSGTADKSEGASVQAGKTDLHDPGELKKFH
jgi:two-component system, NarL family, nitrate/nitrite response regulator NarL